MWDMIILIPDHCLSIYFRFHFYPGLTMSHNFSFYHLMVTLINKGRIEKKSSNIFAASGFLLRLITTEYLLVDELRFLQHLRICRYESNTLIRKKSSNSQVL